MATVKNAPIVAIKGKAADGKVKIVKYDRSFLSRIIQHSKAKPFYSEIKNYCLSFAQVKSRPAWGAESFTVGKDTIVKMIVYGGELCLCLALSPEKYDAAIYPHKDCSSIKSYQNTPMMVAVTSSADLKRVKRLIGEAFTERFIYSVEFPEYKDYTEELAYKADPVLVKKQLIKATESVVYQKEAEKLIAAALSEEEQEAEEVRAILPKKEPKKAPKDLSTETSMPAEEEEPLLEEKKTEESERSEEIVLDESEIEEASPINAPDSTPEPRNEEPLPDKEEDREEENREEEDAEDVVFELAQDGKVVEIRYDRSFLARIIESDRAKTFYSELKNYCLSFGLKPRLSWKGESFYLGRKTYAFVMVRGKSLCLYLALDPLQFDQNVYHQRDVSNKKTYEKTPLMLWIRSDLALKKAERLIAEMCRRELILEREIEPVDYAALYPYEERDALIGKKLIKKVERILDEEEGQRIIEGDLAGQTQEVTPNEEEPEEVTFDLMEEPSEESPKEEDAIEEVSFDLVEEEEPEEVIFDLAEEKEEEEEDAEDVIFELVEEKTPVPEQTEGGMESYGADALDGRYVTLRKYVRGFTAKMRQGDQERKDYYTQIKARLLSFKGVKVLESFSGESFKKGRTALLKSRIRGKTLCLFFALDTDSYKQTIYRQQYKGDTKTYADTPMMVRVKSEQGLKRALNLIDELQRVHLLKEGDPCSFVEMRREYLFEETASLVEKGLIKTRLVTVSRYEAEQLLKKKTK